MLHSSLTFLQQQEKDYASKPGRDKHRGKGGKGGRKTKTSKGKVDDTPEPLEIDVVLLPRTRRAHAREYKKPILTEYVQLSSIPLRSTLITPNSLSLWRMESLVQRIHVPRQASADEIDTLIITAFKSLAPFMSSLAKAVVQNPYQRAWVPMVVTSVGGQGVTRDLRPHPKFSQMDKDTLLTYDGLLECVLLPRHNLLLY